MPVAIDVIRAEWEALFSCSWAAVALVSASLQLCQVAGESISAIHQSAIEILRIDPYANINSKNAFFGDGRNGSKKISKGQLFCGGVFPGVLLMWLAINEGVKRQLFHADAVGPLLALADSVPPGSRAQDAIRAALAQLGLAYLVPLPGMAAAAAAGMGVGAGAAAAVASSAAGVGVSTGTCGF